MATDYELCEKYRDMAESVIDAVPELRWIRHAGVRIAYLKSFKEKKQGDKLVFGECTKVQDLYRPFCPYDFIITIYAINAASLSRNQLYVLLWHELLHVGMRQNSKGDLVYRVENHDIEDFNPIIDRFGTRWSSPGAEIPDITEGGG